MRKRIQEERMTEEKNMTRREIREQVFKMLFRVEFYNQEEMSEQIALCEDDACSWKEKDKTYIFEKVERFLKSLRRSTRRSMRYQKAGKQEEWEKLI